MRNVIVQLLRKKTLIENDSHFDGRPTRILAYASIETHEGIIISDISIHQDIEDKDDIRVIYPFRKIHTDISSYITFNSKTVKKEFDILLLKQLKASVEKEVKEKRNTHVI